MPNYNHALMNDMPLVLPQGVPQVQRGRHPMHYICALSLPDTILAYASLLV